MYVFIDHWTLYFHCNIVRLCVCHFHILKATWLDLLAFVFGNVVWQCSWSFVFRTTYNLVMRFWSGLSGYDRETVGRRYIGAGAAEIYLLLPDWEAAKQDKFSGKYRTFYTKFPKLYLSLSKGLTSPCEMADPEMMSRKQLVDYIWSTFCDH